MSNQEIPVTIDGQEYTQIVGKTYATEQEALGYLAEGLPTDAQTRLQDEIDGSIQEALEAFAAVLIENGIPVHVPEHDMQVLNSVYETFIEALNLEDVY